MHGVRESVEYYNYFYYLVPGSRVVHGVILQQERTNECAKDHFQTFRERIAY